MSNDKKTPAKPTKQPAHDSNKGGRGDSVEFAEGYRQLNEVHNAMPPPPNPHRGGGDREKK